MELRPTLEILGLLFQLAGIPAAIFVYWQSKRREQIDRQRGTFDTLAERYSGYLRLCLEHVHLPVFDTNYDRDVVARLNEADLKRTQIIFCELIALFESAFFLYQEHRHSEMHERQWRGWEMYAEDFLRNPAFSALGPGIWMQSDKDFQQWMQRLMLRVCST